MTDTKHIPGPWFIDPEEPLSITTADGDNHTWRVARAVCFCGHEEETAPANARLISAAPDLLAVAIEADSALAALGIPENGKPRVQIRAAIAKARGQA